MTETAIPIKLNHFCRACVCACVFLSFSLSQNGWHILAIRYDPFLPKVVFSVIKILFPEKIVFLSGVSQGTAHKNTNSFTGLPNP